MSQRPDQTKQAGMSGGSGTAVPASLLWALPTHAPDIARIHAPIGLDIGAVSPAEIAVSIMAEITDVLRKPAQASAAPRAEKKAS